MSHASLARRSDPDHRLGRATLRREPVHLLSLVLLTAGSALCGVAQSLDQLIVFRVIQGIGGGTILPSGS